MSQPENAAGSAGSGRRLTVRQVAEQWQIYPGTVRKAIRAKELPAVWAGNGYRMVAEDVEAWIRRTWAMVK